MKRICGLLVAAFLIEAQVILAAAASPALENSALRLELSLDDGSLTLSDRTSKLTWRQAIVSAYKVEPSTLRADANNLSYRVTGPGESCDVTIALSATNPSGFDLTLSRPGKNYTYRPTYPFHFVAPAKEGWFYVQNTTGEGMLMPLERPNEINKAWGWNGSQPWYGLTDLQHGLSVRLDSFRNPDNSTGRRDLTAYALPMQLRYDLVSAGGYVAQAKLYRDSFLAAHPELKSLQDRITTRPSVGMLKDGVYVYFWGNSPQEDLELAKEMKSAGIDRGFAVFYGKHPIDRQLFDGIKELGWVPGIYQMPTGNLFRVGRHGWANEILTGQLSPSNLRGGEAGQGWDRICAKYLAPRWREKSESLMRSYAPGLFYFDTLAVQLAPCLSREHPSSIEENQAARLQLARDTQKLGVVVGSGEGLSPTWALPGLDFFEGLMSLRTYADPELKIPHGGYETDLGDSYKSDASYILDEKRRIPLYQLAFHDYVAGTWVWRDTNFQSRAFAWKKDLFNILYGTMPMWHINRQLWAVHKDDYLASYRALSSVRSRIGFARMLSHGWLTPDRRVQYTDWDNGERVIVNFSEQLYKLSSGATVAAHSYLIQPSAP